jgi:hypothetical protein
MGSRDWLFSIDAVIETTDLGAHHPVDLWRGKNVAVSISM